jgi:hypothetical protein
VTTIPQYNPSLLAANKTFEAECTSNELISRHLTYQVEKGSATSRLSEGFMWLILKTKPPILFLSRTKINLLELGLLSHKK